MKRLADLIFGLVGLFILLVPEAATEKHLQLLSELAQMFSSKVFRESLTAAPDIATVKDLIEKCAAT